MNTTKIKKFWNDHKIEIVSAAIGAVAGATFVGYANATKTDIFAVDKMIDRFVKDYPQFNKTELVYTIQPKKSSYFTVPDELAEGLLATWKKGDVLPLDGPIIYGQALLIKKAGTDDALVGVMPL